MKKLLLLSFLFLSFRASAQTTCSWAYIPTGTGTTVNTIYQTLTDRNGAIIQCGKLLGVADMDPASGPADTSFTVPAYNYYLSKTDVSGKLVWIKYFNSSIPMSFFEFAGLEVTSNNEIIVGGNFYGLVDFDLSSGGVDTLRSHQPTYPDYFVSKYTATGNLIWAFSIGEAVSSGIKMKSFNLMPNDNILVSANPTGVVDVDPGPAVHNTTSGFGNNQVICYDSGGNYVWNKKINVTYSYAIPGSTIAADASGNVYVLSVGYYEMTITKFDPAGSYLTYKTFGNFASGGRVDPATILIDQVTGELYVAGTFGGTIQFDPFTASLQLTSSSSNYQDGFIAKFDSTLHTRWVKVFAGELALGTACLDRDQGDIVAVGSISGTVDLGSGYNFTAPFSLSPFYLKMDTAGVTKDAFMLNGTGRFYTVSTTASPSGFVTSGNLTNTTDMDPSAASVPLATSTSNFFTAVYANGTATSLLETARDANVNVYPNPSFGSVTVHLPTGATAFRVTNLLGQKLKAASTNEREVFLEFPQKGVYVLTVIKGDQLLNSRIVVE